MWHSWTVYQRSFTPRSTWTIAVADAHNHGDRGPDSAGVAIYGEPSNIESKITIQSDKQNNDLETLESVLRDKLDERLNIASRTPML